MFYLAGKLNHRVKFEALGLNQKLLEGLDAMGFKEATPVQQQTMPLILGGRDLIACAQTGTGKTAAFLLPTLHAFMEQPRQGNSIRALVVVPTRELALQIDQALEGLSYFTDISSFALYGGGDGAGFDQQKKALTMGTDIIIATPGKLISHLNMGYVDTTGLSHLVLDEADRMLDMGFFDDIMRIVSFLPAQRQTLMFSATMPPKIRQLAQHLLKNPEEISLSISRPAAGVMQVAYLVHEKDKVSLIKKLLDKEELSGAIVFARTKRGVKEVSRILKKTTLNVEEMHSDLTQDEREEVMRRFRNRKVQVLVATDILARGIDIKELQLVVNFDVPDEAEDYVHRVGRTARADQTGIAITLITPAEQRKFNRIEALIQTEVRKLPVPAEVGESFEYNPNAKAGSGGRAGNQHRHKPKKKKFGRPKPQT
jgi:superfamily II DNA/RNA helicase